jgi:hypothetical protein
MKNIDIKDVYNFITTLIIPQYVTLKNNSIIMSQNTFQQLNYIQRLKYHTYNQNDSTINFYKLDKNSSSIAAICKVAQDNVGNVEITIINHD